ncbi:hypothetical protein SRHO_G00248920 [Serrasalmus rhombeus]
MFLHLLIKAAESERQTGEKTLELLTSVCTHSSFPYGSTHSSKQREFLLNLFSHVKHYETQTGRNVLPALQPVYQSAPAEWIINLSERKSSLFLEVLKLQTVKKPVELTGWSDEESEVRSFLQCLPYISQLGENSLSSVRNQSFNAYSRNPKASAPQRSTTFTAAKGSRKTPLLPGHLKIQRLYQEWSLTLQTTLQTVTEKMNVAEEQIQEHEARISSLETALTQTQRKNEILRLKLDDLEGRSRRNNSRSARRRLKGKANGVYRRSTPQVAWSYALRGATHR